MAKGRGLLTAVLVLLVVLGVVGGVAGSAYTSSSTFCTSCHEMSTRYVSWTRSSHNSVECLDCHGGVGLSGYIKAKVGGARQMFQHYFGEIGDIHAVVEDAVCMKCHFFSKSPTFVADPAFGDNPMYVADKLHRTHFNDPDSTCVGCHFGLVHGSLEGGIPVRKQVCDDCHRQKKVLVEVRVEDGVWSYAQSSRP